ncbi:MAG TPA: hypothetical protein VM118_01880 [Acidobacteriota bacterium]|nr:hypothetical protein [Acidobacteriota bacterium]
MALMLLPVGAHPNQLPDDPQEAGPGVGAVDRTMDSVPPAIDSARAGEALKALSTPRADTATRAGMEPGFFKSPTGALLRSVAFPGWGQWSNGKKKKAAVYFAVETFFITKALIWRHRARESGIDFTTFDFARDRRNFYYWLTGFTIFISMFDAYGDRYLLYLERTRDAGDEFWGGRRRDASALLEQADPAVWRLVLEVRF